MKRTLFLGNLLIIVTACGLLVDQEPQAVSDAHRVIHADVVAIDQDIVFNRFGSHDPYGMIYALRRDVVANQNSDQLQPGQVRMRSDKRPRPLVLRANEGDILEVTFTNLLNPKQPGTANGDTGTEVESQPIPQADIDRLAANNPCAASNLGSVDAPKTRCASIALSGITPIGDATDGLVTGLQGIVPGQTITYRWRIERKGSYLFSSLAAPSGGQGDGGSLVHGLFGTLNVEASGSRWYRSAVNERDFKQAQAQAKAPATLNYEAVDSKNQPLLNLLKKTGKQRFDLQYSPLDAIIVEQGGNAFREFSVMFHDELKTVYRPEFDILSPSQSDKTLTPYAKQLAGVRDGFAINYGASGMGTILLANRLGIGPAKNCVDCQYEEFFLQSWANGDPALLASYDDDPSNVHHSYLNDPVQFRNTHAGPKETHVFHLHAHQWESSTSGHANYLDSQTIGPQQSFAYAISHQGSGNLNQTPGDSIFHCHLYPHFAQGMWALWRVHDAFEDGSRRLPDGGGLPGMNDEQLAGNGTDPMTGLNQGGSPIPAIVPLPNLSMPTLPSYGANGFPGYPFYIPGQKGHRAPQPPIDIVEDGGLGRHIVTAGTRHFNGGPTALEQVKSADMTLKVESAQLLLLPAGGTQLEKNAMQFHETAQHASHTPDGQIKPFMVNGKSRQPGAPFADPCGKNKNGSDVPYTTRRYRASVIDLDIKTNEHDWHDPQSRINVLDDEVARFEHKRAVKDAEPFFFRAESGECVEFLHTNRTHDLLKRDSFQVATPTDIIGQHIHLVKFDVTSSDGSGNGFNYEDGTLSWEAIDMLTKASRAAGGSVIDENGQGVKQALAAKTDHHGKPIYQTTIQRWWVDPYFHEKGFDAGLGTVFTHDHFAPSSIQHHGFYNALLVEPKGSQWLSASGRDLKRDDRSCNPLQIPGLSGPHQSNDCLDSHAVGSRAQIVNTPNREDTREFVLAIADYALLYDAGRQQQAHVPFLMNDFAGDYQNIAAREGYPVDPPQRPEAISTDHHNPYLINYKHEPMPLRLAKRDSNNDFSQLLTSNCEPKHHHVNKDGSLCNPGDAAYAFSSLAPHGDPFLPPLRAYEGDKVLLRLIQGAQEVQHSFSIHDLNWQREGFNDKAPLVNAQEIGISEHFELRAANLANVAQAHADHLFKVNSQDALWNGAWGLLRVFNGKDFKQAKNADPASCYDANGKPNGKPCFGVAEKRSNCSVDDDRFDRCELAPLPARPGGNITAKNPASGGPGGGCPVDSFNNQQEFTVEAWQLKDLFNADIRMPYDRQSAVYDPNALVFMQQKDREKLWQDIANPAVLQQYRQGEKSVDPLVLRVESGKCVVVKLINKFPLDSSLADADGDALMPKITSLNVDKGQSDYRILPPSNRVSLHPQLLNTDVAIGDGVMVGRNQRDDNQADNVYARPGKEVEYHWYAGTSKLSIRGDHEEYKAIPFPHGAAIGLTSADVIGQGSHGLIGALIIEPPGYTFDQDSASHLSTWVSRKPDEQAEPGKAKGFREFVVLYQDGLNLYQNDQIIPDCAICDDSYDFGEQAVNYRSPAFWQRLGLVTRPRSIDGESPKGFDLNQVAFPPNFFAPDYRPFPFADFVAEAGEEMRFHVLQPTGRSRQRSFQLYGHSFKPWIENYGSPWTMLMAPGKAETLVYPHAQPGNWLFRDGPAHIFANGSWGRLVVK